MHARGHRIGVISGETTRIRTVKQRQIDAGVLFSNEGWESFAQEVRMNGHWIGTFVAKGDETEVEFTEHITVKKIFLKPFVKAYLKKQQAQFISDLKKALS